MENFSKSFHTIEGTFTLTFSKIASFSATKYFVVSEREAVRVAVFEIKQNKEGEWKVLEPASACIIQSEATLAAAIDEFNKLLLQ